MNLATISYEDLTLQTAPVVPIYPFDAVAKTKLNGIAMSLHGQIERLEHLTREANRTNTALFGTDPQQPFGPALVNQCEPREKGGLCQELVDALDNVQELVDRLDRANNAMDVVLERLHAYMLSEPKA